MFFADVIQWFVKTPNHAVFGGCTYHRRNGVLPKNGKDPVENHQQKPQNEDIITLWSRTIPTPSQPGFPCCTLNYSWPLSPTSSVFSTNPMVDVKHFSFQQLCAKLAVGACEANVQLNYTRSRVEWFLLSRTIPAPELIYVLYILKKQNTLTLKLNYL